MNNFRLFNRLFSGVGFSWLLFMLMFPSTFNGLKYVLLVILLCLSFIESIVRRQKLDMKIILGIFIWYCYFSISLLRGYWAGFSVDFAIIQVYFLVPSVSILLSSIINSEERFTAFNRMLICITFIIVLFDLFYMLSQSLAISLPLILSSNILGPVIIEEDFLTFRISNMTSLIFLFPYSIGVYFSNGYVNNKEKYLLIVTIFLGTIVVGLSGRRVFQVITLMAFPLTFFITNVKKRKLSSLRVKRRMSTLLKIIILVLIMNIVYQSLEASLGLNNLLGTIFKTIISAFDFATPSGSIRSAQVESLLYGWLDYPLIGNGLNSFVRENVRSTITPWSYEMVYIALLFQAGVIGFSIFFITVLFILMKLYKRVYLKKDSYRSCFLGILVGFICVIIAGATNPMISQVWIWSIALIAYQNFGSSR